eukprot:EC720948.1.p2 GENE.EC720948.1~~EC720948.1.p2  ORF type:complete len:120 (+),score=14.20 EC720948.1:28-387(+)
MSTTQSEVLSIGAIVSQFFKNYREKTSSQLQTIDAFLVAIFLTGVIQFAYCVVVGTFPFNSFLSGFIASVGAFVLTVSLRMHVNAKNSEKLSYSSPERAFFDYVFAMIVLFIAVFSFMG